MPTHYSGPLLYDGRNKTPYFNGNEDMPVSINTSMFTLMDDFAFVSVDATNDWTVVKDASATVTIVADTVGGELALTSAATTDNDGASIQGNEIFAVTSGKPLYFQTRIKNNKVNESEICVGFTVNFATNPEAMLAAADRICFQVDDGNASVLCKTEKGGVETSTDSGFDMVNYAYVILGIQVVSASTVNFYINGGLVATHTTNIPNTENLAVAAMSISGDNLGTRVTTLDYILAAAAR